MKKKFLSVFIACVMVFAMIPMTAAGAEEVSIPISNRAELEAIADNLGGTYHLTADIVLSGAQAGDWVPLGSSTEPFTGTLDGRGFEIRWLRMGGGITTPSGPPNAGLFSHISGAHIKNLGMVNTSINTDMSINTSAGAIAARAQGERSFITNCYNTGNVSARASWGVATSALVISSSAGGLVGIAQANSLTISSSYNTGSVFASANSRPNFSGSSSTATAGGIIGEMYTGSVIRDCYNRGDITANIIAGSAGSGNNTRAGGIVGFIASDSISNTYNTGNIQSTNPQTANRHIGSIFGLSTVAINMFNNYESANIGNIFNFIGFDFKNVWIRISGVNDNLPVLRAFYNFCAVCDKDPCVCVVAPDLCIECKKEICVCCLDCNTDPCACIDAPDLCIECKKEICVCKPEPKVCTLCNETPCVCGVVAIAPGSSPVVSVIIAPKTKISIGGGEPFEADADKLTLKVVKKIPDNTEVFFAALKDYLSS